MLTPPLDLQQRFAEIVSTVEEQKAKMRKHLEQLDDLRLTPARLPRRSLNPSDADFRKFCFLQQEFFRSSKSATRAELQAYADPRASCFHARHALELMVIRPFKVDKNLESTTGEQSRCLHDGLQESGGRGGLGKGGFGQEGGATRRCMERNRPSRERRWIS